MTAASYVPNDAAFDRIVAARCARAVQCQNLGPDKRSSAVDQCTPAIQGHLREQLSGDDCTSGIDGAALDKCIVAIQNEGCSNPLEQAITLNDCRAGNLCPKSGKR